ncbi:MAG TPA: alpha-galactosidase [Chloroflexota bacterium]|nr:alpha-galactosidase [Chloroflexota bacterium]
MTNPNSGLYRAHPESAIHFPTCPRAAARHQLVLDLAPERAGLPHRAARPSADAKSTILSAK